MNKSLATAIQAIATPAIALTLASPAMATTPASPYPTEGEHKTTSKAPHPYLTRELITQPRVEAPQKVDPIRFAPTPIQPNGFWDDVSRVFLSETACERQAAYYMVTFRALGVCAHTDKGTWLLKVQWRG